MAEVAVSEAVELEAVASERGEQSHHPRVAKAQGGDAMALVADRGALEAVELFAIEPDLIGEAFGSEESTVDLLAERFELPEGSPSPSVGRFRGVEARAAGPW